MNVIELKPKRPTLTVNIGDESFDLPLTFNRHELEAMGKAEDKTEAINDFMAKYLGDVFEELGDDDLRMLMQAWKAAREEIDAPDMGESTALPK